MKIEQVETTGKCASCKSWFNRIKESILWVDCQDVKVEICQNCADDFYPEVKES